MQEGIRLENIVKTFGKTLAVDHVSLDIEPGSFTTLLGPSGCGKTTLLRILAGLEEADAGKITVGKKVLFDKSQEIEVPARKRGIGLVFQSYALWPHMTVFDNVAYGLKINRESRQEISRKVQKVLETVEMTGYEKRYPSELSGGQQQRVSMARMLVTEPTILLMDEPLSNLDAKLRLSMRAELKRIHREVGLTVVYVTHDQTEATTLSTKIAVMKHGVVQQYDDPKSVYRKPVNLFVADFMGNPKINTIEGVVRKTDGKIAVRIFDQVDITMEASLKKYTEENQEIMIAIRPEDIEVSEQQKEGFFPLPVMALLDSGPDRYVYMRFDHTDIVARDSIKAAQEGNEKIFVRFPSKLVNVYDKSSGEIIA